MNICVFKNYKSRSWDLAQLVKYLSLKHENLSAALRAYFKSSHLEAQQWRDVEERVSGAHYPASIA